MEAKVTYTEHELEEAEAMFVRQLAYASLRDLTREAGISLDAARSLREGKWIHGEDIVSLILWRKRRMKYGEPSKGVTVDQAIKVILGYIRQATSCRGREKRLVAVSARIETEGQSLIRRGLRKRIVLR